MQNELWEFLVPCVHNNGRPFKTRHHREWDRQVRRISGGLTIYRPAQGQWIGPAGELYKERMIPVRVMCNELQAREICGRIIKHYEQLAAFAYRVSEFVIVVDKKD